MDSTIIAAIITGILAAVVTNLASYLLARQQFQLKIDETLRTDRVHVYMELWKLTALLPQFPPAEDVTYQAVRAMSEDFRKWYFETGGIYLSEQSRDAYFDTQRLILTLTDANKDNMVPLDPHDENGDYKKIRLKIHDLRTQLAKDIGARRAPGSTTDSVSWSN